MLIQAYSCFTSGTAVLGVLPLSQTVTGTGTTIVSTNDIDLTGSSLKSDIAIGVRPIYVVAQVTTAMTGTGTIQVNLQQSANAAAGTYTNLQTIGSFAAASAAGTVLIVPIQGLVITQRYLSVLFSIGGTVSAGAICVFCTPDPSQLVIYPRGDTISTS